MNGEWKMWDNINASEDDRECERQPTELTLHGFATIILSKSSDDTTALHQPCSLTGYGKLLYVARSGQALFSAKLALCSSP